MKRIIIILTSVLVILSLAILPCFAETYLPQGASKDYLTEAPKPIWAIRDIVWRDGASAFLMEYPTTYSTGYSPNVDILVQTGVYNDVFAYTWGSAYDPSFTMWSTSVNTSSVDFSLYGNNFPIYEVDADERYRDEIRVVDALSEGSINVTWAVRYMYVNTGEYHIATLQDTETYTIQPNVVTGIELCPPTIRGKLQYPILVLDYTMDVVINSNGTYTLQFWNRTETPTEMSNATESFLIDQSITTAWDGFDITAFFQPVAEVLQIPIFGQFTLGGILTVVVAFSLVMLLLKFFAGG